MSGTAFPASPLRDGETACTLVVPGLLAVGDPKWLVGGERLRPWENFLARAGCADYSAPDLSALLFDLFGVDTPAHQDLPVAAVGYRADAGRPAPGWCLRADPVHLVADRDKLVMLGPERLSLCTAEVDALAAEFNGVFAQDGWRLEACAPTRWYLHLPDDPQLRSHELARVSGRAIGEYLPRGVQGKQWQRVLNEVQMLFHASPVNRERQARGEPTVNSLWFWGSGRTPSPGAAAWHQLWSNDALAAGLAQLGDIPRAAAPQSAQDWLARLPSAGEHLLVLDGFAESGDDPQAWYAAMARWQSQWLEPLLDALARRDIARLSLCPADGRCFHLTRAALKRWWRRRRPLAGFLSRR